MAKTAKLRMYYSPDDPEDGHETDFTLNVIVNEHASIFSVCTASCCTKSHDFKEKTNCETMGDALMALVLAAFFTDKAPYPVEAMIDREWANELKPYLKVARNGPKFARLLLDFRDAINEEVEFDRTIILYP